MMLRFALRRSLQMVPVLFATVTLTFFLIRLAPGGPFTDERARSPETIRQLNAHYGLDAPIMTQYGRYLWKLVHGDMGPSFKSNQKVQDIIAQTFPVSLELGCYAMLFALVVGLAAGLSAALKPRSFWRDHLPMTVAMTGICIPSFVLGPLLVLWFSLGLNWVSASGWQTAGDKILPALTLGAAYAAYIGRLFRGSMLEILPQDYIRTARAKGAREFRVIFVHAMSNALPPVVAFLSPAFAGIITGSFVVETVFQIPGMGRMFVTAAFNRDYTLLLGLVVFYSVIVVIFNILSDMLLIWLNPGLRNHE
jgi:oligopeptide transport system permease protein